MAQIEQWITDANGMVLVVITGWSSGMIMAGFVMAIRAAVAWLWSTLRSST